MRRQPNASHWRCSPYFRDVSHFFLWLMLGGTPCRLYCQGFAGKSNKNKRSGGGGFGTPSTPPTSKHGSNNKLLPTYTPDDSKLTQDLISYLLEEECEGIGAEGGTEIGFDQTNGRRGLFATATFQQGELIMGVPFPCCLTLAMDDISIGEPSDVELGLRLLRVLQGGEGEEDSNKLFPYFQTLPTIDAHFDATPDFWTKEEIHQLEIPQMIEKAIERKHDIQLLASDNNCDLAELQFATWLVKSRGFTLLKPVLKEDRSTTTDSSNADDISSSGEEQLPQAIIMSKTVLMPYLDFINHESKANAELQVLETKAEDESFYALQAIRDIPKGSEITISYGTGQESSVELLSNYGFIADNNPNDAAFMSNECKDHQWSTTLQEDEAALKDHILATKNTTTNSDPAADAIRKTILEFRVRMKKQ